MTLKPGARLVREWRGESHDVLVLETGFSWRGQTWRSLSAIAQEITGAHWSGPRFFGLVRKERGRDGIVPGDSKKFARVFVIGQTLVSPAATDTEPAAAHSPPITDV